VADVKGKYYVAVPFSIANVTGIRQKEKGLVKTPLEDQSSSHSAAGI
jgi:hypothetical protein